jgi:hypothetical protein
MVHSGFLRPNRPETVFRTLLSEFKGKSNLTHKKAVGSEESKKFLRLQRFSGGSEGEPVNRLVGPIVAVRTAGTARLGTGAEGFVDNGLDGARAAAAFGAATEASVNLLWIARQVRSCQGNCQVRSCNYGTADIMVAKDVTGTNNHENGRPIGDAGVIGIEARASMQKEKPQFQAIPN